MHFCGGGGGGGVAQFGGVPTCPGGQVGGGGGGGVAQFGGVPTCPGGQVGGGGGGGVAQFGGVPTCPGGQVGGGCCGCWISGITAACGCTLPPPPPPPQLVRTNIAESRMAQTEVRFSTNVARPPHPPSNRPLIPAPSRPFPRRAIAMPLSGPCDRSSRSSSRWIICHDSILQECRE